MNKICAVITRPLEDSQQLSNKLKSIGIDSLIEPLLQIKQLSGSKEKISELLEQGYDHLIITSGNAVESLVKAGIAKDIKISCIGDNTTQKLQNAGFKSVNMIGKNVKNLKAGLKQKSSKEDKYVYISGKKITSELDVVGYDIKRVVVYEAVFVDEFSKEFVELAKLGSRLCVVLYSLNTAKNFERLIKKSDLIDYISNIDLFCLSENICQSLKSLNFAGYNYPEQPDTDSLLELIGKFYFTAR